MIRHEVSLRGDTPPKLRLGPGRKVILLAHGYNVSERRARRAYSAFEQHLAEAVPTLREELLCVHWPGDTPGAGFLVYPWKVRQAPHIASTLAEFLSAQPRSCEIVVVGHSLGCRLLLSTLSQLPETGARVSVAFLMAGAVPVNEVMAGGPLNTCFSAQRRSVVLFSPDDRVLRLSFWAGESFAGKVPMEPGDTGDYPRPPKSGTGLPEAIGLHGRPRGAFNRARLMPYFGHNDYWKSPWTARGLAHELGYVHATPDPPRAGPPVRTLPGRGDAPERSGPMARLASTLRRRRLR
jgi:pimeloyl-ACP methyl ester carboxylesterase